MPSRNSGYVSVSIKEDLCTQIRLKAKALQDELKREVSISKCIEIAFNYYLDSTSLHRVLKRCGVEGGEQIFNWNDTETRKQFNNLFDSMNWYKSTEWIMSDDHDKEMGDSEWPEELKKRIKNYHDFKFEKILIISEKVWKSPRVWRWIWPKFSVSNENPDSQITILVTREKKIDKYIDRKYFDMGIYGDEKDGPFMGFLDRRPQQNAAIRQYKWRYPPDESLEKANNVFKEIGKVAESPKVLQEMLWKHGLSTNIRQIDARDETEGSGAQ